ncbi:MAG: SpoIIE family protein phosphatase [Phycisphaerae bacterium]
MDERPASSAALELKAASGPTAVNYRMLPPHPITIGRRSTNALQLDHPAVSRTHARLSFRSASHADDPTEGVWLLADCGSSRGTWLNGVRLKPNRQYHLRARDLIVIGPWTLQVVDRSGAAHGTTPGTTLLAVDDTAMAETILTRVEATGEAALPSERLHSLLRCAEQVYGARTQQAVADAVLDAAAACSGFARSAVLGPTSNDDMVEVIASRGGGFDLRSEPSLCRALIREAACGVPAALTRPAPSPPGMSQTDTVVALCVPIMVESTLAGFLYFDQPPVPGARGGLQPTSTAPGDISHEETVDTAFPVGLARLAGLGLAGLMRVDIERRQERMEAEVLAAMEAQRWLLPPQHGCTGPLTYAASIRQGRDIGGDFYDFIPLSGGRLAVICGDVGGKGIPVSVLVSASQGFLHAVMEHLVDPARAAASLNRLFNSRISHARFLKLWLGVFDPNSRKLAYIDAGHGNAMMMHADGRCELLPSGTLPPVGMEPNAEYRAQEAAVLPGARTCIVSDGFVEQRACEAEDKQEGDNAAQAGGEHPKRFGVSRIQQCLRGCRSAEGDVIALFNELERHTGGTVFDDDATAVVVRW